MGGIVIGRIVGVLLSLSLRGLVGLGVGLRVGSGVATGIGAVVDDDENPVS